MPLSPELEQAVLKRIHEIPITTKLKMEIAVLSEGYCEVNVPRDMVYDGVSDSFHGGLLMTIADSTACYAIFTKLGARAKLTTTDMNIRFLAQCLTGATAKATIIKFGRTLIPVAVDLFDEAGVRVAVAQVTYFVFPSDKNG
jgi:uncharacterized protein (TIGR00369 family)